MSIPDITAFELGKFLQIAYSEGVRNQISTDFRDWEMIKRSRVSDPDGRQLNFLIQTSLGPSAIQYVSPGVAGTFPSSQQITTQECNAFYKELASTIEIEYSVWDRARKSPSKYAEPLAKEIESKTVASKRRLAADLYGDGTGVVGRVLTEVSLVAGLVTINLNAAASEPGHVGFFEFNDVLSTNEASGAPRNNASALNLYRVVGRSRKNDQVTLQAIDAAGANISPASTNLAAGDYLYRSGQPTKPNRAAPGDYGIVTEAIPGLFSLAANDGRLVHGITMSGVTAGSQVDAAGNPLDVSQIQELMSNVKTIVGQSAYSWKQLVMAPEALDSLIESRETDRRFNSVEDTTRGARKFVYQHQNDSLECITSEYVQKKLVYALPEAKSGQKVIESYMTDFEPVTMGNQMSEFHLKPVSGGYQRSVVSFMQAMGTLVVKHPASIAVLKNFAI
jgi:hypothetical protein